MQKLFLFLLLLAAFWLVRRWLAGERDRRSTRPPVSHAPAERAAETMCECAHCGVCVPASEGVQRAGLFYCSEAHARAAQS